MRIFLVATCGRGELPKLKEKEGRESVGSLPSTMRNSVLAVPKPKRTLFLRDHFQATRRICSRARAEVATPRTSSTKTSDMIRISTASAPTPGV